MLKLDDTGLTKKAVVPEKEKGLFGGTRLTTSTRYRFVDPEAMSWYGSILLLLGAPGPKNPWLPELPAALIKLELLVLGPMLAPSDVIDDGVGSAEDVKCVLSST